MSTPRFNIGEEVFTHNPSRYIPGATAIIGEITKITPIGSSFKYAVAAGRVSIRTGPNITDFHYREVGTVSIFEVDLGYRTGTPISELYLGNGRVTDRFVEIANSWGYP